MTVALRRTPDPDHPAPHAPSGAPARIDIFDDLARAEPYWRRLEAADAVFTPYQRFDFLAPWQRHVGARSGVSPAVVIAFDADGEPLMLCPFGRRTIGAVTVAEFLGGKHANFNMALWRRHVPAAFGLAGLQKLLAGIKGSGAGIDVLSLRNQPLGWRGTGNPFTLLPHQEAPSFGFRGGLSDDFEQWAAQRISSAQRGKIRRKERSFAARGPVRYWRVDNQADAFTVVETFLAQKGERMRELGLADVFAEPGVREFIREAATAHLGEGSPAIELYAMAVGDTIIATAGGVADETRFSTMFNSMIRGELAQKSPGLLLLYNLVRMNCERGLDTFDLGVGEAYYKDMFCDVPEPLVDSFMPLTARGRIYASAVQWSTRLKRSIKQSAGLWKTVQTMRQLRVRFLSSR